VFACQAWGGGEWGGESSAEGVQGACKHLGTRCGDCTELVDVMAATRAGCRPTTPHGINKEFEAKRQSSVAATTGTTAAYRCSFVSTECAESNAVRARRSAVATGSS
jgi:hypothetical protein